MKIYINATGPDQVGGYFTYITNLVVGLALIDSKNSYCVYCNGKIYNELKNLDKNFKVIKSPFYHQFNIIRFFWMQLILPFILLYRRIDILFSPLNAAPLVLKFFNVKSAMVIHSNLPWTNPRYLPYGSIKSFIIKILKELSLKCSDVILCVSQSAKKELVHYTNIDSHKVHAIHLGFDEKIIEDSINNSNKYLLYVANSAIYHNHLNLLTAFNLFIQDNHTAYDLYLVMDIVDKNQYKKISHMIQKLKIAHYIKIIPPLDKKKLYEFYNNAVLYIFPSLAETFGMTTLEAMAHGTPVICSNVSAMPEVNGDAAIYFNPLDPMDISDKIKLVIKDKNICDRLIINGFERVRNFTWHETAEKTVALFQSMAVD